MEKKDNGKKMLRIVWSLVMIFVYLSVAFLLACTEFFENISTTIRYSMAALFAIYGIFRGYRLYRQGRL